MTSSSNNCLSTYHRWTIVHFMKEIMQVEPGVEKEGPVFSLKHAPTLKFCLNIVPRTGKNNNYASLWLFARDLGDLKSFHFKHISFWLENSQGQKFGKTKAHHTFKEVGSSIGFEEYMTRANLNILRGTLDNNLEMFICCRLIYELPIGLKSFACSMPGMTSRPASKATTAVSSVPIVTSEPTPKDDDASLIAPASTKKRARSRKTNTTSLSDLVFIPPANVSPVKEEIDADTLAVLPIKKKSHEIAVKLVPKNTDEFRKQLWELHKRGVHDCILKVGSAQFKASKFVLMAQSSVFEEWFKSSVGKMTVVTLNIEVSVDTMNKFIEWFYLGSMIGAGKANLEELYRLADEHKVPALKSKCVTWMTTTLTQYNVRVRYALACDYKEDKLMKATKSFIDRRLDKGPV